MWFVTPALTGTFTDSTTVMPSISVSSGAAVGNWKSLLMKNCGFEIGIDVSLESPSLTVLTDTAVFVPGSKAAFAPFTNSPNTSSKNPTSSLYSSEANTYLKFTVLPTGTKSNSRSAASIVAVEFDGSSACRSASPGNPLLR
jgi:hypothetical protein